MMAVRGYRKFKVRDGVLVSACLTTEPWGKEPRAAGCLDSGDSKWDTSQRGHELAQEHLLRDNCACGLYAYKDRNYDKVRSWSIIFPNNVTAAVTMWGAIVEYDHGYRAEYMQIDHLWLDGPPSYEKEQQAAALTARYGVGCDVTTPSLPSDTYYKSLQRTQEDIHEHR